MPLPERWFCGKRPQRDMMVATGVRTLFQSLDRFSREHRGVWRYV